MESSLNDQHSGPHAPRVSKTGPPVPRESDHMRRNRLNMEKMILKNVAASRTSTKNRAQQILEALKKKRQLEKTHEDRDNAIKKTKMAPAPDDATAARTAVAAGMLSPCRGSAAGVVAYTSPARRQMSALNLKSSSPPGPSPARARAVNPLHLVSPARPLKSAVVASPARPFKSAVEASPARPKRSGTTASPLRRKEFLTSPLRHRASTTPKRPLVFDESTLTANESASTTSRGHPPVLSSALEQVDIARGSKTSKATKTVKSPFQSFQDKYKQSPMKSTRALERSSPSARADSSTSSVPCSVPTLDLSHVDATAPLPTPSTGMSSGSSVQVTASRAAAGEGDNAASTCSSLSNSGDPVSPALQTAPKPMRQLFSSSRPLVAHRSMCFSTENVATALDVTPDGEIIVVGFMDGSVRLYEMYSNVPPSDRYGYLLGYIDDQCSQGSSNVNLRVKISPDGRYVFVGCRQGPRVIMSFNLDYYRSEKDGDDEDFQQFQKHYRINNKLRGFAAVTTYVPPIASVRQEQQDNEEKRSAYYILTGLGVRVLHLWRFVEPKQPHLEPIWEHLQDFDAGGNTATTAAFLPSTVSPGVFMIAAVCEDKNLRVWPLEFKKLSSSPVATSSDECSVDNEDTSFLGGNHTVTSYFSVQNTSDIIAIHGQYAYGISLMGEAYRICLPDASNVSSSTCKRLPRQEFQLEKINGGGGGTSRRSNVLLESLSASDDGKTIVAVSTEGIFYYSSKLPDLSSSELVSLRIIGKSASENTVFKTPMKVYTSMMTLNGTKTQSEAMMAVVTNPSSDGEKRGGYINVDPTKMFASRWMVPSRGNDCWVCGVRNMCHWKGPPESKTMERNRANLGEEQRVKLKAHSRRERAQKRARNAAKQQEMNSKLDGEQQETSTNATIETTSVSSAREDSSPKPTPVHSDASASGSVYEMDDDDGGELTGSDDNARSRASLVSELEHLKKRNAEITTELQRRLQGEWQLRSKWKRREEEFLNQLHAAEVEINRQGVLLRDAEKRLTFETVRKEQENAVKARYERLCAHMNDQMALVVDKKRLLEQTTRSLLTEVDRYVHASKNAVLLEPSECVVCKDQQAVTAIVPCGHLCFCEADAEKYRHNYCAAKDPTCPICQEEMVALLRIINT
ncbi:hypothetical protein PsorP6_013175 [Peronosclerospora sorghi]|uniref:Uncharacterized protein n=1 Tax=Peronosclerospora sorghi TaxID=230839 RepID=A0ACC0WGK0_9STRA|nr:hypothetical protein PsorP6_013175 [Peronosclerospora sorghi]